MKNRFFIYLFILLLLPCTILFAGCNEPPPGDGNGDGGDIPPSTENSIVSPPKFEYLNLDRTEQERIYNIYTELLKNTEYNVPSMTIKLDYERDFTTDDPLFENSNMTAYNITTYNRSSGEAVHFDNINKSYTCVIRKNNTHYKMGYEIYDDGSVGQMMYYNHIVDQNFAQTFLLGMNGFGAFKPNTIFGYGYKTYPNALELEQYHRNHMIDNADLECQMQFFDNNDGTYTFKWFNIDTHYNYGTYYDDCYYVDTTTVDYTCLTVKFNEDTLLDANQYNLNHLTLVDAIAKEYISTRATEFKNTYTITMSADTNLINNFDISGLVLPTTTIKQVVQVYLDGESVFWEELPAGTTISSIKNRIVSEYGPIEHIMYEDPFLENVYPYTVIKSWKRTILYCYSPLESDEARINVIRSIVDEDGRVESTLLNTYIGKTHESIEIPTASKTSIYDKITVDGNEITIRYDQPITASYVRGYTRIVELIDYNYLSQIYVNFFHNDQTFASYNIQAPKTINDFKNAFKNLYYFETLKFDYNYVDVKFYLDEELTQELADNYVVDTQITIYLYIDLKEEYSIVSVSSSNSIWEYEYSYHAKSEPIIINNTRLQRTKVSVFKDIYYIQNYEQPTYEHVYSEGEHTLDISTLDDIIYIYNYYVEDDGVFDI